MLERELRMIYALGPGDVVGAYRLWQQARLAPFEMSIPFSHTFIDWCEQNNARAHLIACNDNRQIIRDGRYVIENRPRLPWYWSNGLKHHLGSIAYGLSIMSTALRERPELLALDSGTTHWMVASLAVAARIPVIAVLHSALWPAGFPPVRRSERLVSKLDGLFFRHFASAAVCVSPECERQVRAVAGTPKGPILQYRVQFPRGSLDQVGSPPPYQERPFNVLFVGRIEENKGVFLILSIAEELEKQMPGRFNWRMIGSGGAFGRLKLEVQRRGLQHLVDLTGRLPQEEVLKAHGWAHAEIVPTMSSYREGLAMTAIEAALAGRPVVLSTVVPAGELLGDAAILVPPDDTPGFVSAFRRLALDVTYYRRCRDATASARNQFLDGTRNLGTVLGRTILATLGMDSGMDDNNAAQ